METFEAGDLVTFRLHGDDYGLAHILLVESMTTYSHFHLTVLDAVLEADDGGIDSYGVLYQRSFNMAEEERAPVAVDHIALTLEAFAESSPAKIDFREVTDEDMAGYQVWLLGAREQLLARGLIHADRPGSVVAEEDDEGEYTDDDELLDGEEEYADDDIAPAMESGGDDPESVEAELDHLEREELEEGLYGELLSEGKMTVELRPWHRHIFDRPLGEILFELRDEIARDNDGAARIIEYITEFFSHKGAAINELIERFVNEGDYGAGHELMVFGEAAADALAQHLQEGMDPQVAEDITNVLCDMGSIRAYEHIAQFFLQHETDPGDPLYYAAARGFCYAVMLTGGTPEPLHAQLSHLEDITIPELAHDVAAARDAVQSVSEMRATDAPPEASSNPFGLRS